MDTSILLQEAYRPECPELRQAVQSAVTLWLAAKLEDPGPDEEAAPGGGAAEGAT